MEAENSRNVPVKRSGEGLAGKLRNWFKEFL
jgi:hypothetical protein